MLHQQLLGETSNTLALIPNELTRQVELAKLEDLESKGVQI